MYAVAQGCLRRLACLRNSSAFQKNNSSPGSSHLVRVDIEEKRLEVRCLSLNDEYALTRLTFNESNTETGPIIPIIRCGGSVDQRGVVGYGE